MKHVQPSLVLSCIAVVLALGGTATAASLITGAQIKNSSITGADIRNGSITKADVKGIGARGPAGPAGQPGQPGPAGPQGAQGPAGTSLAWASIRKDGSVESSKGSISVTHPKAGIYCVTVPNGKIAMGTLGTDGGADTLLIAQGGLSDCPDSSNFGVQVGAGNGANITDADNSFAILVE